MGVERDFSQGMKEFIQKDLGARGFVACSQASYGGLGGVWREANMDWVDMHAYWQHPGFPNKAWDQDDYIIGNTSMTGEPNGGTLPGIAMHRVEGKPFTLSEYDHPAPNEYAAEGIPIIFAYAAWQDWDGVFPFAYDGARRDRISGFFDLAGHPGKMAFIPAAAQMFLRGGVPQAPSAMTLPVPRAAVAEAVALRTDYGFWGPVSKSQGGPAPGGRDMVERRVSLKFVDAPGRGLETSPRSGEAGGGFAWPKDGEPFMLDTPAVKGLVGFLGGKAAGVSGLQIRIAPSPRNFAALVLASLDGKPTRDSRSLLLTAVDKVENPGLEWNPTRTYARNSWAQGPTMAEVPSGDISLDTALKRPRVYALDGRGARVKKVKSSWKDGRLSFAIGPQFKTLWYEISAD